MPFIEHNGQRILFIHIPKTGGSSIEHWLGQQAPLRFKTMGKPIATKSTPQHLRFSDMADLFGKDYFDYAFTIVRNPYDRIASEYRMQAIQKSGNIWKDFIPFDRWLESMMELREEDSWARDNHLRAQWQFTSKHVEVFRYEDGLDDAVAQIASATGLTASPLEKLVSSEQFKGEIDWDVPDYIRVQEAYRRDFKQFGYERLL